MTSGSGLQVSTPNTNGFAVRVNTHNLGWNGEICRDPTKNTDCKAKTLFKAQHCARGEPDCFHLNIFREDDPSVRLHKNLPAFGKVLGIHPAEPGDLVFFWSTYGMGGNWPVGMWQLAKLIEDEQGYTMLGDPSTVVQLPERSIEYAELDVRISRKVGADAFRLLRVDALGALVDLYLETMRQVFDDQFRTDHSTDDSRAAIAFLERISGEFPADHLTQRIIIPRDIFQPTEHPPVSPPSEVSPTPQDGTGDPTEAPTALTERTQLQTVKDRDSHDDDTIVMADFPAETAADYQTAVAISQLVILAGPSGAGKTRLTRAYAEDQGARYELVPVRPDWRSNEDLLGWLSPFGGDFVPSSFSLFVLEAAAEFESTPAGAAPGSFQICLDELNLARPEYFLAEVLSAMEQPCSERYLHLYSAIEDKGFPRQILLPPNLCIVGTVNNDETTHPLSAKVLDRAVYLTLDNVDLAIWFEKQTGPVVEFVSEFLLELDGILRPVGVRLGYRVARKVLTWVEHASITGTEPESALDAALVSLIFPKLRLERGHEAHVAAIEQLKALLGDEEGTASLPRSRATLVSLAQTMEERGIAFGQQHT